MKLVLLDNFDSFTHILAHYLIISGFEIEIIRNDKSVASILKLRPDAIVLSPGPGSPQDSGSMMDLFASCVGKLPILGICLGHQAIGLHYGAQISNAPKPMHGKVSMIQTIFHPNNTIFEHLPVWQSVARYHSLVVSDLPDCLSITAKSSIDDQIMGLVHQDLPVWGLQFHPEAALTHYGQSMLKNWYRTCEKFYKSVRS